MQILIFSTIFCFITRRFLSPISPALCARSIGPDYKEQCTFPPFLFSLRLFIFFRPYYSPIAAQSMAPHGEGAEQGIRCSVYIKYSPVFRLPFLLRMQGTRSTLACDGSVFAWKSHSSQTRLQFHTRGEHIPLRAPPIGAMQDLTNRMRGDVGRGRRTGAALECATSPRRVLF